MSNITTEIPSEETMTISYVSDAVSTEEVEIFKVFKPILEYQPTDNEIRLRIKIQRLHSNLNTFAKMFQILEDERWYLKRNVYFKINEKKRYKKLCEIDGREFNLCCFIRAYRQELRYAEDQLNCLKRERLNRKTNI